MYLPFTKTKDGFESHMAVNFLGHALLTHLLIPQLTAGSNDLNTNSRIVNVSSCAHECGKIDYKDFNMEKHYNAGIQYGNSKLAQLLFSNQIDRIFNQKGLKIQSHCVHPGVVDTEIFSSTPIFKYLNHLRRFILKVKWSFS
jgi:NAD(P)-dependent dehydrogenase (short-subunit alcohol dehydrogenase family)